MPEITLTSTELVFWDATRPRRVLIQAVQEPHTFRTMSKDFILNIISYIVVKWRKF